MSKNAPTLRLVNNQDNQEENSQVNGLRIVSSSELSPHESTLLENTVKEIYPKNPILGVVVTKRSWDLRPIISLSDEEGPSFIRFLGPEVTLSLSITARISDLFERFSRFHDVSSKTLAWGVIDGQVWYRRELVERTLEQALLDRDSIGLTTALTAARRILTEVINWHARGIIHGHITSSNIVLTTSAGVALLDPGVAIGIVQASKILNFEEFPGEYLRESFAPELLNGEGIIYASDIYGVALVLKNLLAKVKSVSEKITAVAGEGEISIQARDELNLIHRIINDMLHVDPSRRPPLRQLLEIVSSCLEKQTSTVEIKSTENRKTVPSAVGNLAPAIEPGEVYPVTQGKIVRAGGIHAVNSIWEPSTKEPVKPEPNANRSITTEVPREVVEMVKQEATEKSVHSDLASAIEASSGNKQPKNNVIFYSSLIFALFVIGLLSFKFIPKSDPPIANPMLNASNEEMRLAWESGQPSLMFPVVEAALNESNPVKFAELLLINSALKGEELPEGINVGLIRVVFDKRWEIELTPENRRTALALAAGRVLLKRGFTDLAPLRHLDLTQQHPALILGLTATTTDEAKVELAKVSAEILTSLPPPIGPAFRELVQDQPELDCGSDVIRVFSRLATRGVDDALTLNEVLSTNTRARLRALAQLFSQDNTQARHTLEMLINHPNLVVDDPAIKWAKMWNIIDFNEIASSDQLLLLAGIPPITPIKLTNLPKLFNSPYAEVRSYAIVQGIDRIKFSHPGAIEVLSVLRENPQLLDPSQTMQLTAFLEFPDRALLKNIRNWLATQIPQEILEKLLLSTIGQPRSSTFDFEISRNLQERGWNPDLTIIRKLIKHPDNFTRLFAYSKVFSDVDLENAQIILSQALTEENDPAFKEQIQAMLNNLSTRS